MPTVTITIECNDEQAAGVILMLSRRQANEGQSVPEVKPVQGTWNGKTIDQIAAEFARLVNETANEGFPSQLKTMEAWLAADGHAPWRDLVTASGAKDGQGFAGVAGSLSKNMLKAGGVSRRADSKLPQFPLEWYGFARDLPKSEGIWSCVLASELVEPLKRAFAQFKTT